MQDLGSRLLNRLRMAWLAVARRRQLEEELDDELRFHFESTVESYIGGGATPDEARRRARLEYRGPEQIKEDCRDARGTRWLDNLRQDTGYALRGFARSPGFALAAAGTIALGISANAAVFSVLYTLTLRPLPVRDALGLKNVYVKVEGEGWRAQVGSQYFVSYTEFNYLREHSKTAQIAGVAEAMMSWKPGAEGTIRGQLVSENLLPMIGAHPRLGRLFTREDAAKPGSAPVVVLSYAAWQRYFGGAQDVVGKTMLMNRTPFTIVGVSDEQTKGPLVRLPDLWIPYTTQNAARPGEPFIDDPNAGWIQVFARPNAGTSDGAVSAEMAVLAQQAIEQSGSKRTARVTVPRATFLNAPGMVRNATPIAAILFLAVALVLLVACSNVANLLVARGLARQREIAIRLSIGAGEGGCCSSC